jgi:hypothetical protein
MRNSLVLSALVALPLALLATTASASPGLSVSLTAGKGRAPVVVPGETYVQSVSISVGRDDRATDATIEVLGCDETADRGIVTISAEEDTGDYSARKFITPEKTVVHVEPGETRTADLIVRIPPDVGAGGRYATLRISGSPSGQGSVGIVSAMVLVMKFTVQDGPLVHTAKITELGFGQVVAGHPLGLSATIFNTGNHHYKIQGVVEIFDQLGQSVGSIPVADQSPVPGGTRRMATTYTPSTKLAAGTFSANWRLTLEDGTLLDESRGSLDIPATYAPPAVSQSLAGPSIVQTTTEPLAAETPIVSAAAVAKTNYTPIALLGVGAVVLAIGMYLFGVRRGRGR